MTVPRKTTRTIDFSDIPEASVDQLGGLRRLAMRRGHHHHPRRARPSPQKVRACVRTKSNPPSAVRAKASSVDWRTRRRAAPRLRSGCSMSSTERMAFRSTTRCVSAFGPTCKPASINWREARRGRSTEIGATAGRAHQGTRSRHFRACRSFGSVRAREDRRPRPSRCRGHDELGRRTGPEGARHLRGRARVASLGRTRHPRRPLRARGSRTTPGGRAGDVLRDRLLPAVPIVLARLSHLNRDALQGSPGGVVAYGAGQGSEAHTKPGHPPKTPTMNAMVADAPPHGEATL